MHSWLKHCQLYIASMVPCTYLTSTYYPGTYLTCIYYLGTNLTCIYYPDTYLTCIYYPSTYLTCIYYPGTYLTCIYYPGTCIIQYLDIPSPRYLGISMHIQALNMQLSRYCILCYLGISRHSIYSYPGTNYFKPLSSL